MNSEKRTSHSIYFVLKQPQFIVFLLLKAWRSLVGKWNDPHSERVAKAVVEWQRDQLFSLGKGRGKLDEYLSHVHLQQASQVIGDNSFVPVRPNPLTAKITSRLNENYKAGSWRAQTPYWWILIDGLWKEWKRCKGKSSKYVYVYGCVGEVDRGNSSSFRPFKFWVCAEEVFDFIIWQLISVRSFFDWNPASYYSDYSHIDLKIAKRNIDKNYCWEMVGRVKAIFILRWSEKIKIT